MYPANGEDGLDAVCRDTDPDEQEIARMQSPARPIVLVSKRVGNGLSELIAPGLAEIGVMLLLKSTLVLAAAALLAGGVRRGSAATRYAIWIGAVAGLLALPLLPVAFPGTNLAWITSPSPAFEWGAIGQDIEATQQARIAGQAAHADAEKDAE